MRGAILYAPGDVRLRSARSEDHQATDRSSDSATCVSGPTLAYRA